MADKLAPPPDVATPEFKGWLFKLRKLVTDLSEPVTSTSNLSAIQAAALTNGGDTALHYHSFDRNRANHTGTQTSDTISDLSDVVQALISASAVSSTSGDPLGVQVFGP